MRKVFIMIMLSMLFTPMVADARIINNKDWSTSTQKNDTSKVQTKPSEACNPMYESCDKSR